MALLAFNKTGTDLVLAAGIPAPRLPASSAPPAHGAAVNVTSELRGLSPAAYTALQVQVAADLVDFEWTDSPEFPTGTLFVSGPAPGPHQATHATGGPDALTVAPFSAANGSSTTGTSLSDSGHVHPTTGGVHAHGLTDPGHGHGLTDPGHTHSISGGVHSHAIATRGEHEVFLAPAATGGVLQALAENVASIAVGTQTGHPRTIDVDFAAGWDGGDITINGFAPDGTALSVLYTSNPGSLVEGTKVFARLTNLVNSAPAGAGAESATAKVGRGLGLAKKPVTIVKLAVNSVGTIETTNVAPDPVAAALEGWFEPGTACNGIRHYEAWYATSISTQLASSGAVATSSTGASVNSSTTGTSVADADAAVGVDPSLSGVTLNDPGHTHVQAAHAHLLT